MTALGGQGGAKDPEAISPSHACILFFLSRTGAMRPKRAGGDTGGGGGGIGKLPAVGPLLFSPDLGVGNCPTPFGFALRTAFGLTRGVVGALGACPGTQDMCLL